jgi:hypothetical protein
VHPQLLHDGVHAGVGPKQQVEDPVAEGFQTGRLFDEPVEIITVGDEKAPAVGGLVNRPFPEAGAGEETAEPTIEKSVMIAGDVRHRRHPGMPKDLFNYLPVRRFRRSEATRLPAIEKIADEVQGITPDARQKGGQVGSLAPPASKVDI